MKLFTPEDHAGARSHGNALITAGKGPVTVFLVRGEELGEISTISGGIRSQDENLNVFQDVLIAVQGDNELY